MNAAIDRQAIEAGAVVALEEPYPVWRDVFGRPHRYAGTFAVRYFNVSGHEVAYVLPQLNMPLFVFPRPRVWATDQLLTLQNRRELPLVFP